MQSATSALITPRCRICYDSSDDSELGPLIRPCNCSGSVALVHSGCLNRWLENKTDTRCELCHTNFEVISCGLKDFSKITLPHPLGSDFESRLEFAFLGLWIIDTFQLISKALLHGIQAFPMHMGNKFGRSGWLFYFGTFCSMVNLLYYGAVLILVVEQWLWENSVFVLRDRNSPKERQNILARIQKMKTEKTENIATCQETSETNNHHRNY